jgi:glycosyltransferase involved in cell wall biosynthesis
MKIPRAARWSVVIPYFNEKDYLPATLASLRAQTFRPFRLILVDNASTDGSAEICRSLLAASGDIIPAYLDETRPGKINALERGLAAVDTEFVAFCDADTYYPPHYLERCARIFDQSPPDVAAVMATDLPSSPRETRAKCRQLKAMLVSRLLAKQGHTGGFGQTFRTAALREAGGFSAELWPFVLEDHEVMQRVLKIGRARYDFDLWCIPSQRRNDREGVNWTLWERILYHTVPFVFKDWFFYNFLHKRFQARQLGQLNLREKTWI